MEIKEDTSIKQFIFEEIQRNLGKEVREGIHLSDLLSPRKAYWQKTVPMLPETKEIIYWLSGRGHESAFLRISNFEHGEARQWEGIWYTPDILFNFPVEIKTTRRGYLPKEGDEAEKYAHYLKQVKGYCAITEKKQAWLIVWYLSLFDAEGNKTTPDFFTYRVEFTDEELEEERKRMLWQRDLLLKALETHEFNLLEPCEEWMCFRKEREMITKPFCKTCNKEFNTSWGINKHINSRTGSWHEIVDATYIEKRVIQCKYYEMCIGGETESYDFGEVIE